METELRWHLALCDFIEARSSNFCQSTSLMRDGAILCFVNFLITQACKVSNLANALHCFLRNQPTTCSSAEKGFSCFKTVQLRDPT